MYIYLSREFKMHKLDALVLLLSFVKDQSKTAIIIKFLLLNFIQSSGLIINLSFVFYRQISVIQYI